MALLSNQQIAITGLNPSLVAAAGGGDSFANEGQNKQFLWVDNAGGSSINVTIDDILSVAPTGATSFNADVVVAVTNAQRRLIGPFPSSRFGDTVSWTYSAVTSVTVGVFKV